MTETVTPSENVRRAIRRLSSLHDGERGVSDATACGRQAVPALRALLFARDPSGLYQVRCRAVEALARLNAHDVLIEFLSRPHEIADPVEQLGEDAVVNAAALALAGRSDGRVFPLLLDLARRSCLTGVISALGKSSRIEAIPALVEALADDASRPAAEAGLTSIGRPARAALLRAASEPLPNAQHESDSSRRRRRSALRVLTEIGITRKLWPSLRNLLRDPDAEIATTASELCFRYGSASNGVDAVRRLIALLSEVDWRLRDEIEDRLVAHYDVARELIMRVSQPAPTGTNPPFDDQASRALLRVRIRAEGRS